RVGAGEVLVEEARVQGPHRAGDGRLDGPRERGEVAGGVTWLKRQGHAERGEGGGVVVRALEVGDPLVTRVGPAQQLEQRGDERVEVHGPQLSRAARRRSSGALAGERRSAAERAW